MAADYAQHTDRYAPSSRYWQSSRSGRPNPRARGRSATAGRSVPDGHRPAHRVRGGQRAGPRPGSSRGGPGRCSGQHRHHQRCQRSARRDDRSDTAPGIQGRLRFPEAVSHGDIDFTVPRPGMHKQQMGPMARRRGRQRHGMRPARNRGRRTHRRCWRRTGGRRLRGRRGRTEDMGELLMRKAPSWQKRPEPYTRSSQPTSADRGNTHPAPIGRH